MTAYYNDLDGAAADVLEVLIAENVIAHGVVDRRSIAEVQPSDLIGFVQCHFFAGAGLWSVAARMAGWPDDKPLWTGSCPCQPFSVAGKGAGVNDVRHLWPDFFRLIGAARPALVVGEQVAGKAGRDWFHGVRSDLESAAYVGRAVDVPALAVDAPHIRNRLYWLAVADADRGGRAGRAHVEIGSTGGRAVAERDDEGGVTLGAALGEGLEGQRGHGDGSDGRPGSARSIAPADGRNGSYWSDAEWITCHDGKARRTKSGLRLLVDGMAGRTDLWRLAGNSIVPQLAAEVLKAYLETESCG